MENENKVYNIAEAVDGEDFDLAVTCYINPLDPSDGKKTIKYKAITEEKYESFLKLKEENESSSIPLLDCLIPYISFTL